MNPALILATGCAWLAAGTTVGVLLGAVTRRRDRQVPDEPWWTPDQIEDSIRRAHRDGHDVMVDPLLSVLARHDPARACVLRDELVPTPAWSGMCDG